MSTTRSDIAPLAVHVSYGFALGAAMATGTLWSSWPLLAGAVCIATAWAWRVTRL